MELCLRFNKSEIRHWAERYTECQNLLSRKNEKNLIGRKICIQRKGFMTLNELDRLSLWKSVRQSKRVREDNCESTVKCITKAAFASNNDWDKLKMLMDLEGISFARASAILHLYDEGLYPIIDVYAAWSVDKNKVVKNRYTKKFWCAYIPFCRELARQYGNDMRMVDRALMHYGYIHYNEDELDSPEK